jgi:NDP-sugar pyrophosphorylase family protein
VTGSYVGPFTAIAGGCTVDESEIEYSIVLSGTSIRGVGRIGASLIGHDAEVTPASGVPSAHRLVLGDHTLAVLQALLGFTSEARWIRRARVHMRHLFPYLPRQPDYI